MENEKIIYGESLQEVWHQIEEDLNSTPELLQYQVEINQSGRMVMLDIDVDLGGGFEGGFEITSLSAPLPPHETFRFALHHESFLDELGKFFGMEDHITGYPEFDKNVVVKTNNPEKFKTLFADNEIRLTVQSLQNFRFYIAEGDEKRNLVFEIEEGVTEPQKLKELYKLFFKTLILVDKENEANTAIVQY